MEKQESVLTKITSYEAGEFQDSPIHQRESSFLYMKDKYERVKVIGYSKQLEQNVQSEAWLIQGVAVYAAVFSSGNAYWASGQEVMQVFNNAVKPKQWFMDRVGEMVLRDPRPLDAQAYIDSGATAVFIKDELQAQYMFDIQNDLYYESGICLNYRDHEEN